MVTELPVEPAGCKRAGHAGDERATNPAPPTRNSDRRALLFFLFKRHQALKGSASRLPRSLQQELTCLKQIKGISLVVQWLRLRAPNAGGPGFDPWSGNKIPHAAPKSPHATTKIPRAATKTQHSQIDR